MVTFTCKSEAHHSEDFVLDEENFKSEQEAAEYAIDKYRNKYGIRDPLIAIECRNKDKEPEPPKSSDNPLKEKVEKLSGQNRQLKQDLQHEQAKTNEAEARLKEAEAKNKELETLLSNATAPDKKPDTAPDKKPDTTPDKKPDTKPSK